MPACFLSGWLYTDGKELPEGHVQKKLFHNCSCAKSGIFNWNKESMYRLPESGSNPAARDILLAGMRLAKYFLR